MLYEECRQVASSPDTGGDLGTEELRVLLLLSGHTAEGWAGSAVFPMMSSL